MNSDSEIYKSAFLSIGKSFRGEIWQHASGVPMGAGYSNRGLPFDIETAQYLKPVFRAIRNPSVREVIIRAGVQTLKTFTCEKSAAYFSANDPGDMCIYDCETESARDHAKSRLGPFLKSFPEIEAYIDQVENRHDISTTELYLPGMTLRIWPLNMSSTQRITLRYVFIHDAFQSKKTGLIGQAKARTTQHRRDKKIIIESQGSDEGDDFDSEWSAGNQQRMHVVCPHCNKGQKWAWDILRDDATRAGFKRGPEESVKNDDGSYNERSIMQNTYYECLHCRGKWLDNESFRERLDSSSYYVAENPNALPEVVSFHWPGWASRRIPWGTIMLEYLRAKTNEREYGNTDPLKQWYQKRAAESWSEKLTQKITPIQVASFDPNQAIENEDHRGMVIDCQKHEDQDTVGTFWFECYAADKSGNSFQLERGFSKSWEELLEAQKRWKIENRFVSIDGRKWTPEVLRRCAMYRELAEGRNWRGENVKYWSTWQVLLGDSPARHYKWAQDNLYRVWSPPTQRKEFVELQSGKRESVVVPMYRWSNSSIKDQLKDLLIGGLGMPKFTMLSRNQLPPEMQLKETGDLTWDKQLSSEIRQEKNGRPYWEKIGNRPNHGWDIACMRLVRLCMRGLVGHLAVAESN